MIGWILLTVYIVGIPCWIWIEKRFFPWKEGDYTIDFDGAHEITPEVWQCDVCARAGLWPLVLAFIIVLLPFKLIDILFEIL